MRLPLLLIASALLLIATSSSAAPKREPTLPPKFESQLVELYSDNQCAEIVKRVDSRRLRLLRPNLMAIVASCDPPWVKAEDVFRQAEQRMPTGDLILVLHAIYRTRKDPKSAEELWKKVLLIARNQVFIQMANDYFAGDYSGMDEPINLSPVTLFGNILVGAGQESNPRPPDFVYLNTHGSTAAYARGDLSWRHWYPWGSLAADMDFSVNQYFSESIYNSQEVNLKVPVSFHVSSSKDIVFQPLLGYSRIGGATYHTSYGLGVLGVVYKSAYRQSVQAYFYQDTILIPELTDTDGSHYRFEYSWEFFPELSYISMLLAIEHISSFHTYLFNGVSGYFPWSHTNIEGSFKLEQNFRSFTLGLAPSLSYRIDSEDSTFPLRNTGEIVSTRRTEWTVMVKPYVTIPIMPYVQLMAWYSYFRVFSDIGPNDYVNRNQTDHVGALALKAALSTY